MPNRILRDSIKTSKTLDKLSSDAEILFYRLTTVADDYGRFDADPRVLLANCFPLRVSRWKPEKIVKLYRELEQIGCVKSYKSDGNLFGYFISWSKHQNIRAKASKFPAPADENICLQMKTYVPVVESVVEDVIGNEIVIEPPNPPAGEDGTLTPVDLFTLWNQHAPKLGLAKCNKLTPKWRDKCKFRLKEFPDRKFWELLFIEAIPRSRGLLGGYKSGWRMTFEFLIRSQENVLGIVDGKYELRTQTNTQRNADRTDAALREFLGESEGGEMAETLFDSVRPGDHG